ncbi:hypothetical protein ACFYZ4_26005 [Streptomyces sp. NPDC001513]|uniref:hypothetical protein n=1 Tax=Streptomyces sp. NPDC001513 TaxID=3364580 RepID=UPI0036C4CCC5
MPEQSIMWTVLPRGGDSRRVRFTVHVAPRLRTDGKNGTLRDFPDWTDWPATLAGASFRLRFPETGATPARLVSTPDSARWAALFAPATTVLGHSFTDHSRRLVRSYPVGHVLSFLTDRWGRFGATAVDAHPSYDELVAESGFGAIGFEEVTVGSPGKSGYGRHREITEGLETSLRSGRAIRFNPAEAGSADGLARAFLQMDRFHQRNRKPGTGALAAQPRQHLDFHQAVAGTREYRQLQRLLGLVLEFEVTDPATVALLTGAGRRTWASLEVTWSPKLPPGRSPVDVLPRTRCQIGGNRFEAAPRDDGTSDTAHGMLRVGHQGRFLVVPVDPDGGALLSRQFADTVTRSRMVTGGPRDKRSYAGADRFALPALRSAGLSVARLGRAAALSDALGRATEANSVAYDAQGVPRSAVLDLFAEDLVRGERWDVRDMTGTTWRSLTAREGEYVFHRDGRSVAVTEEGQVSMAPTTSGVAEDTDLYLGESLMRWNGWSLAVGRVGRALQRDGSMAANGAAEDPDFPVTTRFSVPGGSLARLRFGHGYRFRARAVDLGGDSADFTEGELFANEAELQTPTVVHRRFEPVPGPEVLARAPHTPGESARRVVIRSENGTDTKAQPSQRHVVPARAAQALAEQHGLLDSDAAGRPLRPDLYATLAARDAARLEDLPAARREAAPHEDSWYFDTDSLPVPYLPDPLVREFLVRGLPGTTTTLRAPAVTTWPEAQSFRLKVARTANTSAWTWSGRELEIRLAPGHEYVLQLSSRFDSDDLAVLGVWQWIEDWVTAWNSSAPSSRRISLNSLREAATDGRHPMLSPAHRVTAVHAVRTPLQQPNVKNLTAPDRPPGATAVRLGGAVLLDRRTTGNLDVLASWEQPVDNGPGTPDPVTPRIFKATPLAARVTRNPDPDPGPDSITVDATHDFDDTRHRVVTYTALATSRYVEHFREETAVRLAKGKATLPPCEASTLKLWETGGGRTLSAAPPGSTDPATATGDYVYDPAARLLTRTANGSLRDDTELTVSLVAPGIHQTSEPETRNILSAARPAPPVIRQVVPLFHWDRPATGRSRRRGNAVRVYLERPWWSSGPGERLGVVVAAGSNEPPEGLRNFVTAFGADPSVVSTVVTPWPRLGSFPRATAAAPAVTLPEHRDVAVSVAGHPVSFDQSRDLWFCDIELRTSTGLPPASWFPFLRLALVRYQPDSLDNCSVSKVVQAPMAQLAPERTAGVTRSGNTLTVTVTGPAYTRTSRDTSRPTIRAVVEQAAPTVPDPHLRWMDISPSAVTLTATGPAAGTTWSGTVPVPTGRFGDAPMRLRLMETETHLDGHERVVYLDFLPL